MYLVFSQVYPPDPAAVGQHVEDAAVRLAERGNTVTVYTADRDYDDPKIRYDASSRHPSVRVVRLPWSSFGKRSISHRLLGQSLFLLQCFFVGLFKRRVEGVIITTIPATTGLMFLFLGLFRRFRLIYWVMDLNPDQAVIQGVFKASNPFVKVLEFANRQLYRCATQVVVMDSYMRYRLLTKKGVADDLSQRLVVIPPWPMESHLDIIPRSENSFVEKHGLTNKKRIFMYSGNHSLVHPLTTCLESIRPFVENPALAFLFVGGGRAKMDVESFRSTYPEGNVYCLPYQPLTTLSESLGAADVHIVVMGNPMVGIVHPCKIYGAMAIAKPVLLFGPKDSHLGKLILEHGFGWVVEHGQPEVGVACIERIIKMPRSELEEMGKKGRRLIDTVFSAECLANQFCDIVDVPINTSCGTARRK